MIDLSSDTATKPPRAMLEAMITAPLGDEQKGEDPTTLALEARIAQMLGQESALFLPSGTMANQIAFLVHCRAGDEVMCAENAHVFGSEGAGAAALAGAQMRPIPTPDGRFTAEDVLARLRVPRLRSPRSRVISVEQTTNRGGGQIWSPEALADLRDVAQDHGLALHMDGARLFNACAASGLSAEVYAQGCASVWVDLSKGLACPVGAVLAGPAEFIAQAWGWKHRLGGAMRQSGILAAAGLWALDHILPRLGQDHANAVTLAQGLSQIAGLRIWPDVPPTNILFIDLPRPAAVAWNGALAAQGLRFHVEGPSRLRAVTHQDVSPADIRTAIDLCHATSACL